MLIHGDKDYEDKDGIDLSTGADDFFEYLNYLVTEKYINKLYKISGKVPIKLNVLFLYKSSVSQS